MIIKLKCLKLKTIYTVEENASADINLKWTTSSFIITHRLAIGQALNLSKKRDSFVMHMF